MSRLARIVLPGYPHHLTHRGNDCQLIFHDDDDRLRYLRWLDLSTARCGVSVWAYCLMPNHIHLVAVPEERDSFARTFRLTQALHAQSSNQKYGRTGHLWEGRYYSAVLDERHLICAVRYVERNPVRAGLVCRAQDYPWSSARARVLGVQDSLLGSACPLLSMIGNWADYLAVPETLSEIDELRKSTFTGRPAGTPEFIGHISAMSGRDFTLRPRGRPRKK